MVFVCARVPSFGCWSSSSRLVCSRAGLSRSLLVMASRGATPAAETRPTRADSDARRNKRDRGDRREKGEETRRGKGR